MPQEDWIHDGARRALHSLETNRVLLRRLHDSAKRRGNPRYFHHEAEHEE